MRLARFEWQKILSGKIRWILLAFFCLNLGAYYIYMIPYIPSQTEKEARRKWEKRLEEQKEDIEQKLEFLQVEQAKLNPNHIKEKEVLYDICQEYTAVIEYRAFINGLKERADSMKTVAIFNKTGSFSQKNIQKTIKDFERVERLAIQPMDDTGMESLHQFYLTDILMLLLVCLFCFQTYGRDYKNGTGNLIRATPGGRSRLRIAQMEAVGFGVVTTGLVLYGTNFLATEMFIGFGNLSCNIQGMSMFRNLSFPCTVWQYLMLFMAWKLLALLFICLVFQFFAVWFQGQSIAWVFSGTVMAVSFVLWFFLPNSPKEKLFRHLNLVGLLDVGEIIGNYQNLKVFQSPVSLLTVAVLFIIVLSIVLIGGILFIRGQGTAAIRIEFPAKKTKRFTKSVFSYECYKILMNQRVGYILIVLAVVSFWTVEPWQSHVSREDFYYESYLEPYKGMYTEEKAKAIEKMEEKEEFFDAEAASAFEYFNQQIQYLEQLKTQNKGIVSLRVYKDFFFYEQLEAKNMLYIVLTVLLSVSGLFYHDRKKQMEQLLCTTPEHLSVYFAKIKLAACIGGFSALLVWGVTYIKYFLYHDVQGLQFSIHSLPEFKAMGYDGSILSYMVLALVLRLLTGVYIGILLGFLSQIFILPAQNIICAVLLFVLPLCMGYISQMGYENPLINFIHQYLSRILQPSRLLYAFPTVWFQMGVIKWLLFVSIPIVCIYIGLKMWERKEF